MPGLMHPAGFMSLLVGRVVLTAKILSGRAGPKMWPKGHSSNQNLQNALAKSPQGFQSC